MGGKKMKTLKEFLSECAEASGETKGYLEASRRTGIFWLSFRRWDRKKSKPNFATRALLAQHGITI